MNKQSDCNVFHQWARGRNEVARLVLQEFNGKNLLHLRVFYFDDKGELKPTNSGLVIPYDQIPPLRKGLRKAADELDTNATPEVQPIKANKKSERKKKSGLGASSKSERPPWE
jgi:hypothetical protein